MKEKGFYSLRNIAEVHLEASIDCNLNCSYCYAIRRSSKYKLMSLDTAIKFIDLIFDNSQIRDIEIVFHGREPLLQSINWFNNFIDYCIRTSIIKKKKIRFLMQSNLTLLNIDFFKLINRYNIIVGTSLDGPPYISDQTRGKGQITLNNIKKLMRINRFGGVICLINGYNYENLYEILKFFEEEKIFKIKANLMHTVTRNSEFHKLTHEKIFESYKTIYKYLIDTKGLEVLEANMLQKLSRFLNPPTNRDYREILICAHPFCGGGVTTIYSDTEGNLYPCGTSIISEKFILGNIMGLNNDVFIDKVINFHKKNHKYYSVCSKCAAASICTFGCPAFDLIDEITSEEDCIATRQFYDFLKKEKTSTIKEIVKNANKRFH